MPVPVIQITNRYNALHNLQNDLELPGELQNHQEPSYPEECTFEIK